MHFVNQSELWMLQVCFFFRIGNLFLSPSVQLMVINCQVLLSPWATFGSLNGVLGMSARSTVFASSCFDVYILHKNQLDLNMSVSSLK